jgi:hypothetical protein
MNLAHKSKGHGFSHDGLKALFKHFSDEYFGINGVGVGFIYFAMFPKFCNT